MSTPAAPHAPRSIPCPRCDATLGPEQDWCLECGAPARTRLAPLPNWRLPVAIIVTLIIAAAIALVLAFVSLTDDNSTVSTATTAPAVSTPLPAATTTPAAVAPTTAATAPVIPAIAGTTPTIGATTATTVTAPPAVTSGITTSRPGSTATHTSPSG